MQIIFQEFLIFWLIRILTILLFSANHDASFFLKEFLLGEEALDELISRLLESAEMEALIKHVENFKSFEEGG